MWYIDIYPVNTSQLRLNYAKGKSLAQRTFPWWLLDKRPMGRGFYTRVFYFTCGFRAEDCSVIEISALASFSTLEKDIK